MALLTYDDQAVRRDLPVRSPPRSPAVCASARPAPCSGARSISTLAPFRLRPPSSASKEGVCSAKAPRPPPATALSGCHAGAWRCSTNAPSLSRGPLTPRSSPHLWATCATPPTPPPTSFGHGAVAVLVLHRVEPRAVLRPFGPRSPLGVAAARLRAVRLTEPGLRPIFRSHRASAGTPARPPRTGCGTPTAPSWPPQGSTCCAARADGHASPETTAGYVHLSACG